MEDYFDNKSTQKSMQRLTLFGTSSPPSAVHHDTVHGGAHTKAQATQRRDISFSTKTATPEMGEEEGGGGFFFFIRGLFFFFFSFFFFFFSLLSFFFFFLNFLC